MRSHEWQGYEIREPNQDNRMKWWRMLLERKHGLGRSAPVLVRRQPGKLNLSPISPGRIAIARCCGRGRAHSDCALLLAAVAVIGLSGRGASPAQKSNTNFFTSGSREADQRASQKMAQTEQLTGTGEGAGEKGVKKAEVAKADDRGLPAGATNKAAQAVGKLALFDRLGGSAWISNLLVRFSLRV